MKSEKKLGTLIQNRRVNSGLSIEELSNKLDIPSRKLIDIEKGLIIPKPEVVESLAIFLFNDSDNSEVEAEKLRKEIIEMSKQLDYEDFLVFYGVLLGFAEKNGHSIDDTYFPKMHKRK